eukprot:CAMPEP_0184669482 /NCGR_PEP_ID=MMETSP0308-20130426/77552_1 /TAXON_ID=38269 /ORGANISM="Gloeochaete witrockiana, Strain SAG 46.84" /LENGTH=434 /DNA_ID=CAMNT_0027115771 /DNA_START=10 /DNA_END=1314 /DNA_ORIENTATION=+
MAAAERTRTFLESRSKNRLPDFEKPEQIIENKKETIRRNRDFGDLFESSPSESPATSSAVPKSLDEHSVRKSSQSSLHTSTAPRTSNAPPSSSGRSVSHSLEKSSSHASNASKHLSRAEPRSGGGNSKQEPVKGHKLAVQRDYSDLFGEGDPNLRPKKAQISPPRRRSSPEAVRSSQKPSASSKPTQSSKERAPSTSSAAGEKATLSADDKWKRQYEHEREARIKEEERRRIAEGRCKVLEEQLRKARRKLSENGFSPPRMRESEIEEILKRPKADTTAKTSKAPVGSSGTSRTSSQPDNAGSAKRNAAPSHDKPRHARSESPPRRKSAPVPTNGKPAPLRSWDDVEELDEDEIENHHQSIIWKIMGYNPEKARKYDMMDDRDMEVRNFGDIEKEERRSLREGRKEDAAEERRERARQEAKRKRKGGTSDEDDD